MKTTRSQQLFAEASRYIPGGVNSPVRACRGVGCDPLFIASGHARGIQRNPVSNKQTNKP